MARKKVAPVAGAPVWMVTFADLLASILAFFVMLAAYSTQDKQKLQVVAGSMREAFGTQKEIRYSGIIEIDGQPFRTKLKNVGPERPEASSDLTTPKDMPEGDQKLSPTETARAFASAAVSLRQALREMPEIAELATNIIISVEDDSLNIQLVDLEGRAMFAENALQPNERVRRLMLAIAPTLRRLPNKIVISGHTAAARPGHPGEREQWALSVGRAMAVRDMLANGGLPDDRFESVAGKGTSEPMIKDNPYLAVNRRISLTLKADAPSLPSTLAP
ncbi:hypothetical protein IP69_07820 [Bosea sp. AAP35]|uniref:OmpA/MotB family protein n=1 Tax=Bosea sp. AAP35 TaxID=1523417 RepID=UPI0006B9DCC2|nr:flagellar motor protein MotB [Bosea sp. AAP35]KPF71187.1 hypothetical protein IP69_07820 [Bosea sp. AAP35]